MAEKNNSTILLQYRGDRIGVLIKAFIFWLYVMRSVMEKLVFSKFARMAQ